MAEPARRIEAVPPDDTVIRETPGVCGGYPCVGNTRVPVRLMVENYRQTSSFEATAALHDMLTPEQVQAALDYYAAHPARVDADIETDARAWKELTGQVMAGLGVRLYTDKISSARVDQGLR
jgi:uncharacterized protein (DUF433 family)